MIKGIHEFRELGVSNLKEKDAARLFKAIDVN